MPEDCREKWLKKRKDVYACQKWHQDVWDEELIQYLGHGVTTSEVAGEYLDKIHVTAANANILAKDLVKREMDRTYDSKNFLRENIKLCK